MSDSELSTPAEVPADTAIEQCLRRVVRDAIGKDEEITANVARSRAETILGLDAGYLKEGAQWKARSKAVITAAVEDPPSPEKSAEPSKPKRSAAKVVVKRKAEDHQPRKRAKRPKNHKSEEDTALSEPEDNNEDDDDVDSRSKPEKHLRRARKATSEELDNSEEESALSEPPETIQQPPETNGQPAADDESDYSSVRDDDPPPKRKRQKKSASPSHGRVKAKKPPPPPKAAKALSPTDEEIKRLQGWLVKCGVRKLWHRELAACATAKDKIRHLKGMLDGVGMTGRYSAEKARQIRDARELAAELEATQEFNEQWGQKAGGAEDGSGDEGGGGGEAEEEEEEKEGATRRRLPKGLVDFGDSGDDESD